MVELLKPQERTVRMPSASTLQRVDKCPASAVLPQVRNDQPEVVTRRGTIIHEYLAKCTEVGAEEALTFVPEEWQDVCRFMDLDKFPVEPGEMAAEVSFAYDCKTDTAREIGRNLDRKYGKVEPTEFVGTADLFGLSADGQTVFIGDYKTGRGRVAAAKRNWQLRFLALAACRAYNASEAVVQIIYVHEDGDSFFDEATFDSFDLQMFAGDLSHLASRIHGAKEQLNNGETPNQTVGIHCRYCPSVHACPAKTNIIRALVKKPESIKSAVGSLLTEGNAKLAYERLKTVEIAVKAARNALIGFATENPIELEDGYILGPVISEREALDGPEAFKVLEEKYGTEYAKKACKLSASKKGLEDAIKAWAKDHPDEKIKIASTKREILTELRTRDGVTTKRNIAIKEHRPKQPEKTTPELPDILDQ